MKKYKKFLLFICVYLILMGFLMWGTSYDDKYSLDKDAIKVLQGDYIYQQKIDDCLLVVKEVRNGVFDIQLKSNLQVKAIKQDNIEFDMSRNPKFNIGILNYQVQPLFVIYGYVSESNAVKAVLKSTIGLYSKETQINEHFFIFAFEEGIKKGSFKLDFYDKDDKQVESFGVISLGAMVRENKPKGGNYSMYYYIIYHLVLLGIFTWILVSEKMSNKSKLVVVIILILIYYGVFRYINYQLNQIQYK